ncbi:MAG: NAD(P)-dependent alcohol dehydrogenase [Dokdonella sp.]
MSTPAYAAMSARAPLTPFTLQRRAAGPHDVQIDIRYCGVCHSDLHQVRAEWGGGQFPMVPGHEIVGHVSAVGSAVTGFKVGDAVGVGCFVDSCRHCSACMAGEEQYCHEGMTATYNGVERDGHTPTQGGYSTRIVTDENYVLRIPDGIPLERAAPLLCAGITTYSPLRHFGLKAGDRIAVVGLGGLGHMAVKIAHAMGAHVSVLSSSAGKHEDALRLGADAFLLSSDREAMKAANRQFDFVLDAVSAPHDYAPYLNLLKQDGCMILVGLPDQPLPFSAAPLIMGRRRLAGSLIGGIRETQEMLDFCAAHGIGSEVEVIPISAINEAYERMLRGDVRYRFVIDCATFAPSAV